ncbi:MAG: MerR family transcriptional regulator [Terriglobia bacterium]
MEQLIPGKVYFRIGEVSRLLQTKPYVLRYWESEFPMLRPSKTRSGHRLYRRKDVETIFEIKRLLYEKGFTIEGARRELTAARKSPPSNEQPPLFQAQTESGSLRLVQHELRSILTMLSRKSTVT